MSHQQHGAKKMSRSRWISNCAFIVSALLLSVVMIGIGSATQHIVAAVRQTAATIFSPNNIGGVSGNGDERDADVYPAVAYDAIGQRYLAVWMTARNAGSSSDGFDIYGVYLNENGQSTSSQFRISDDNSVAFNGLPVVVAGNNEFVVAWAAKEGRCRIYAQRVTDTASRTDRLLLSGTLHYHSPSLVYNSAQQRYVLAYVAGDDYLPPSFLGATTDDCGNNAASTSGAQAVDFYFNGDTVITGDIVNVSAVNQGAFRPHLVYNPAQNQYLVAWEDRRNAQGQAYRFDVYAQRLGADLQPSGDNLALATGYDYTNQDTSATWTPRPAIAAGDGQFLATWFQRTPSDSAVTWSVTARSVSNNGTLGAAFPVVQMSFAQPHAGQSPTGYLAITYAADREEYLVGMTSHLESVWGYFSLARVQRISQSGELLRMDGTVQDSVGIGYSIDYENDDQIGMGLALKPTGDPAMADYMTVYAKHRTDQTSQDYDVWSVRVQAEAPPSPGIASSSLPG
ncbi:MAG: hypothetical protein KDD84_17235, partial [Caldilineaceae bacterium]|nr:hypothetical protein [Caldilineaceae bacterium]